VLHHSQIMILLFSCLGRINPIISYPQSQTNMVIF
jgi:hypothetical protein